MKTSSAVVVSGALMAKTGYQIQKRLDGSQSYLTVLARPNGVGQVRLDAMLSATQPAIFRRISW